MQGLSIGPLVQLALFVDPSIVTHAAIGTVFIFACFSLFAVYTPRRRMLFLGGVLSSALGVLFLISLANIFVLSNTLLSMQVYLGLVVFIGFVCFDTQMVIEKAASGDTDFIWHAVEFFIDFVAIFVRLLVILMRLRKGKGGGSSSSSHYSIASAHDEL